MQRMLFNYYKFIKNILYSLNQSIFCSIYWCAYTIFLLILFLSVNKKKSENFLF